MITGLYGWHFTAKCQRHFSEREIVSSVRTVQSGTYSQLECLLYVFSICAFISFPYFPSACFPVSHHCVLFHNIPLLFWKLLLSISLSSSLFTCTLPNLLHLRVHFAASSHQGQSQCECVLWLTLDMALCAPLGMQTSLCVCFAVYWGEGGTYICLALNFLFQSFSACFARFSQAHKNQCINIL